MAQIVVAWGALALLGAATWLWLSGRRSRVGVRGLQVLARLPLDPRHRIYVVRVVDRVLVVGASDGGLSTLAELGAESAATLERPESAVPGRGER